MAFDSGGVNPMPECARGTAFGKLGADGASVAKTRDAQVAVGWRV